MTDEPAHELERLKIYYEDEIRKRDSKTRVMERLLRAKIAEGGLLLTARIRDLEFARKEADAMLAELERSRGVIELEKAKYKAILASIGDGVFCIDPEGRVVLMNKVAEDLTGYPFAEAMGRDYKDIFVLKNDSPTKEEYPDFIREVMQEGTVRTMASHTLLVRKDGSTLAIVDSAAALKSVTGEIFGAVVVFRDNTKERSLEQAKDEFLSIASHQLRTPLGSMRWNLEYILGGDMGEIDQDLRMRLEQILGSNLRMGVLVGDLLNVSRIDQGRVKDEPAPTYISPIIEAAFVEMEPLAAQRSIKMKFKAPKTLPEIFIDPKRFREVIQNLLSNAVKYNKPAGSVSVDISLGKTALTLKISDTGIGIPEADQGKLFSKFFRASNATVLEAEGNGLGLFVVRSYIEAWGGTVNYASQVNEGTVFTIVLPLLKKREQKDVV